MDQRKVDSLVPEPHPLDFDWRYDDETVDRLLKVLRGRGPVLALGAPSIARALEARNQAVLLIDRQPCQAVSNHLIKEIDSSLQTPRMSTAIADPPWYPNDLIEWAVVAGRAVDVGQTAFVSIWPNATRPSALDERMSVMSELSSWAQVVEHEDALRYTMPLFEQKAMNASGAAPLSMSPRRGSLLELQVKHKPPEVARRTKSICWIRFVVDAYQLAVRADVRGAGAPRILIPPNASGWVWPYVSKRAPGLEAIGLWSSRGEVASVTNSEHLIAVLRRALSSPTAAAFEASLADYPELLLWNIPRPPYRRNLEWRHPQ